MIQEIRGKYVTNKSEKKRQLILNVIGSKVIGRYYLKNWMKRMFSFSLRHSNDDLGYRRKEQKNKIGERLIRVVTEFRERDDNSRIKAGKQGTITRKKVKKQKKTKKTTK